MSSSLDSINAGIYNHKKDSNTNMLSMWAMPDGAGRQSAASSTVEMEGP